MLINPSTLQCHLVCIYMYKYIRDFVSHVECKFHIFTCNIRISVVTFLNQYYDPLLYRKNSIGTFISNDEHVRLFTTIRRQLFSELARQTLPLI